LATFWADFSQTHLVAVLLGALPAKKTTRFFLKTMASQFFFVPAGEKPRRTHAGPGANVMITLLTTFLENLRYEYFVPLNCFVFSRKRQYFCQKRELKLKQEIVHYVQCHEHGYY
jgi:hypothetical protein